MTYPTILQSAGPVELEQAVADNHKELFRQESLALGGNFITDGGLCWTTGTPESSSMIAFPDVTSESASRLLDGLVSFYLRHPPRGSGCWSLDPPRPPDLGVRLLARGWQPGWRPYWMGLDLEQLQTHHPSPKGLTIVRDNDRSLTSVAHLPYARVVIPVPSGAAFPGQWMRFIATLRGRIVGQSVVFMTTGPGGVAGIYHVGVVPRARGKGIGKAVTLAACLYARQKGYRYAVLNSTHAGRHPYEQLGFSTVGQGWTWWLMIDKLLAHPPGIQDVRLAEAIGLGDGTELDRLGPLYTREELGQPMTNGMTPMQLAVHCRQLQAAEWLLNEGVNYTALDAWDLGWKDRARQLLQQKPGHIDRLYGEGETTLLHIAAERNDGELAELALSAHPDLQLKDKAFKATPLEWARHFGHADIIRLIHTKERKA
jgi:GNAT superfamily N-acetyltransferase